jgi:hypothetical protein
MGGPSAPKDVNLSYSSGLQDYGRGPFGTLIVISSCSLGKTMIKGPIARGWENFVARTTGPLSLRLFIQPMIAIIMALRAGLRDARAGRPAYLSETLRNPANRGALLHGGRKNMRTTFLIFVTLDAIYQVIVHQGIYFLEMLFTATLLALVPYLICRGLINRLVRLFS